MGHRGSGVVLALIAAGLLHACASGPSGQEKAPILPSSAATPGTRADLDDFPESKDNRASRSKYYTMERNGQKLYCRRVNKPGSKINSEDECMTAAELQKRSQASKDYVDDVVEISGVVGGTSLF